LVKRKYLGFIGGLRNGPVNVYWAGHREPDEIRFVRIRVAHYRNIWRFGLELSVNEEKRRRLRTTTKKGFWFWTLKETQSDAFHRSFAQTLTSSSCIHSPRSGSLSISPSFSRPFLFPFLTTLASLSTSLITFFSMDFGLSCFLLFASLFLLRKTLFFPFIKYFFNVILSFE